MIPPREDPSHIRVASYNVRKCIGLDRRRRPERTLDVIDTLDADVVVLQEADKRLGQRPSAIPPRLLEKHGFSAVDLATNSVSLGWHGNAILVRPEVEVTHAARLPIPALEPRGAVMAELDVKGQALRLVGVHLALVRRYRRRQLVALVDILAALEPMPTLIIGDFNEWRRVRGFEALEQGFELHRPGRTYHASQPVGFLDRLAVNDRVQVVQCGVQRMGAARRASDHLPIWADLSCD